MIPTHGCKSSAAGARRRETWTWPRCLTADNGRARPDRPAAVSEVREGGQAAGGDAVADGAESEALHGGIAYHHRLR